MNMETLAYPTINMAATGERIKALRKARGLKVAQLSEYMGFTEPQAVYKWQRGESLPSVDNLFALSRLFGIPMEQILMEQEEAENASSFDFRKMNRRLLNHRFIFFMSIGLYTVHMKQ